MKSRSALLSLPAALCLILSMTQSGCVGGNYSVPVVYSPLPAVVPIVGWNNSGFYGGSYYGNNPGYYNSRYSGGGSYQNSRGGSASWGGGSGSWHGANGGSGSWHR